MTDETQGTHAVDSTGLEHMSNEKLQDYLRKLENIVYPQVGNKPPLLRDLYKFASWIAVVFAAAHVLAHGLSTRTAITLFVSSFGIWFFYKDRRERTRNRSELNRVQSELRKRGLYHVQLTP